MKMVLIQFNRDSGGRQDVCVVRDYPAAERYAKILEKKYPSYRNGNFVFTRIKYVKV